MEARRIRVLHCLAAVGYGGVECRRLLLARHLDAMRFEQRIVTRGTIGPLADEIRSAGVEVISVGGGSPFRPRALWLATREARRFRPDIVHGAVFEGLGLAVVAGHATRASIVIEESSHATNRSRRGHALFRGLVAASDACVAVSPAVGEYLTSVTHVPPRKITVITNGVLAPRMPDPAELGELRRSVGLSEDAFVVGSVGRLDDDAHKRYSDLLRAVSLLAPDVPKLQLLLVGGGRLRQYYENLARELGIAERVVFAGLRSDVERMYALMHVFALVSDREAFGLVVPEAMLCGLPVVATAVGGLRDIVDDMRTGILVPPRSPARVAAALRTLHDNPELRASMGSAGTERARRHFSAERYAADVARFYERLFERRARARDSSSQSFE